MLHGLEISGLERASEVVIYGGGPIGLLFVDVLANSPADFPAAGEHTSCWRTPTPGAWRWAAGSARTPPSRSAATAARRRASAAAPRTGDGFDVAIEATGSPAAWQDALASVRPGGLVQLFGGCPPGTTVPLDAHRLHYSEITVEERLPPPPATFRRALDLLASGSAPPRGSSSPPSAPRRARGRPAQHAAAGGAKGGDQALGSGSIPSPSASRL